MERDVAIKLIEKGVMRTAGVWADFGCGTGVFTAALAALLSPGSTIYAIDKNRSALEKVSAPGAKIVRHHADFISDALHIPLLDGILMANALHYVPDPAAMATKLLGLLHPAGCIIIVEYETSSANPWIPYPVPFGKLADIFNAQGLTASKLAVHPSAFYGRQLYSAMLTLDSRS